MKISVIILNVLRFATASFSAYKKQFNAKNKYLKSTGMFENQCNLSVG